MLMLFILKHADVIAKVVLIISGMYHVARTHRKLGDGRDLRTSVGYWRWGIWKAFKKYGK